MTLNKWMRIKQDHELGEIVSDTFKYSFCEFVVTMMFVCAAATTIGAGIKGQVQKHADLCQRRPRAEVEEGQEWPIKLV